MTGPELRRPRVLVVYASAHGSTALVAADIARELTRAGADAESHPVESVGGLERYDAFVIGSAVHNMAWLRPALAFVRRHAAVLAAHPVWLFSVSSVGDTTSAFPSLVTRCLRRMGSEPETTGGIRALVLPREHRNFAGVVDRAHWSRAAHVCFIGFGGRYGDHRDHADIASWADSIAGELVSSRAARGA